MKRFLQLLILACLSFAVVGCYQDSTGPEVPVVGNLTLSQEQMNVSAEGGEYSVDIYTEYMFQASTNVDWIEILYGSCTPEYCSQYFNVKANDTTSPREGIITIFCDDYNLSATLTVMQEPQNNPFSLTISLGDSRTSLGDKFGYEYPLYWLSEDTILCNGLVSSGTSIGTYDSTVATFMFDDTPTPPYNIVYPAPSNGEVATIDGCYPVVFPGQQNYVEGTFDNGAAPMYGYTTETYTTLTHLSGILRVAIKGDLALSHIVVSAESGYISGIFDLNCQTGEITPQEGKASNQIVYNFENGLQLDLNEATPFYIAIPVGSYGMVSLSIYAVTGERMTVKFNSTQKPINPGQVKEFAEFTFTPNDL